MRLRLPAAVFLLCVSSSLLAQKQYDSISQMSPLPPKQSPATASISGTVFCNDTHRPARGAVVMAQPVAKAGGVNVSINTGTSRVAMDGTYTIHHLRPGDYTILAFLPGYLSPFDDIEVNETTGPNEDEMRKRLAENGIVSVRDNETARMDVTLTRGATLSGRVLFDDGAPATQVILQLEDINAKPAPSQKFNFDELDISGGTFVRGFFLHQSQGTDDQGNFRISGIKPGTYRVVAMQPAESLTDSEGDGFGILLGIVPDSRSLRIYGGDTFHKNAAKKYQLRAGDEVNGIEITIPVYGFHRVAGHLTTLDDRPVVSATLTLTDTSDDSLVLPARLGRDGSFTFSEVPTGTYKLAVTEAMSGTLPDDFADHYPAAAPIQPGVLQNMQSLADKTTTILIKDADVTDLSIQLQSAPPTPSQPSAAPAAATSQ